VPAALPPNVGPPVWSPDGTSLVYLQFTSFCGETTGESAVVLVDVATMASRVLLTQSAPEFESVAWNEAGQLQLSGLLDSGQWIYDFESGRLVPTP
jgi:Tol biopolymer transport system component